MGMVVAPKVGMPKMDIVGLLGSMFKKEGTLDPVNVIFFFESMSDYLCKQLSSLFQSQRESARKNHRKLI